MKTPEHQIVRIAKALADRTRVRILQDIARRGSVSCGDTICMAELSQPTVSHHIKVLVDAGLLNAEKKGRHVIISVNKKVLGEFTSLVALVMKP
jgi:ArsR family transcriptional regulator